MYSLSSHWMQVVRFTTPADSPKASNIHYTSGWVGPKKPVWTLWMKISCSEGEIEQHDFFVVQPVA
jgi:hypothetical protein